MDDKTKPADNLPAQIGTDAASRTDESFAKSDNNSRPSASDTAAGATESNDMKPGPHQLQGGMRS